MRFPRPVGRSYEGGVAALEVLFILAACAVVFSLLFPVARNAHESMAARDAERTLDQIGSSIAVDHGSEATWPCSQCLVTHHSFAGVFGTPMDHGKAFVFDVYQPTRFAVFDEYQYGRSQLMDLTRCPGAPSGDVTFIVYERGIGVCGAPARERPDIGDPMGSF